MRSITYFAVLEPGEGGSYGISFPDLPGCFSFADSIDEVAHMAEEAASLHIYGLENDGDTVPEASKGVPVSDIEGAVIMPVTVHPEIYRMNRENERVKTNLTIPLWLKRQAEAHNVNYSRLMEAALMEYLQLPASPKKTVGDRHQAR